METLYSRLAGCPERKGETAEGSFFARGDGPGLTQKMRRTVTYVERYLRVEQKSKDGRIP